MSAPGHTKKPTKRALVLAALQHAGARGVTGTELLNAGCGSRYGARVDELRRFGFVITSERVGDGLYRYTLVRGPDREPVAAAAPSPPPVSVSVSPGLAAIAGDVEDALMLFGSREVESA